MITLREVESRLADAGFHNRFWGRAEVKELTHILTPHEQVHRALNGLYDGGMAMLLATDRRLLLIDKKPLFMTMEDIRYDMISEVNFFSNVFDAGVAIKTINNTLIFKSWRQKALRNLCADVQHRVMELRQHHIEAENRLAQEAREQGQLQQYPGYRTPDAATAAYPFHEVASEQPQSPFNKRIGYPSGPLTIRRRVGRYYPTTNPSSYF